MSNANFKLIASLDAETEKKLALRKKNIDAFLRGMNTGAAQMFGYKFLVGRELLQAKLEVPHGNGSEEGKGFQNWIKANYPELEFRTARNWMQFSEDITAKGLALKKSPLQLENKKKLSAKEREQIVKLVPEVMDGQTMTEFMRGAKLLKEPKPQKYTAPKPPSPAEQAEAEREQAEAEADSVISAITLLLEGETLTRISRAKRKQLSAAFVRANKQVTELTKGNS